MRGNGLREEEERDEDLSREGKKNPNIPIYAKFTSLPLLYWFQTLSLYFLGNILILFIYYFHYNNIFLPLFSVLSQQTFKNY